MLCSPTCVGLRYGHLRLARGFSWQREHTAFSTAIFLPHHSPALRRADLPARQPRCLDGLFHQPALLPFCVPPLLITAYGGTGISACCPSTTPFGLALGPDLPWADEPSPGNLRLSADKILTCLFVTYTGILTCVRSTTPYRIASICTQRSPTTAPEVQSIASVACLAPLHFRRRATRPVSYYALFKWWLLLSQHPGCLCSSTSFPT